MDTPLGKYIELNKEIEKALGDYFDFIKHNTDLSSLTDFQATTLLRIKDAIDKANWNISKAQEQLIELGYERAAERVEYLYNYEKYEPEDWSNYPDDEPLNMATLKMFVDYLKVIELYEPKNRDPLISMGYDGAVGVTYYCDKKRLFAVYFNTDGTLSCSAIKGTCKNGSHNTVSCNGQQIKVIRFLAEHGIFKWERREDDE